MSSTYRGRLAPSPTGYLHLGHARTFWLAQQRALAVGGKLVLRDEDLDHERSRPHFRDAMLEDLRWLGLDWQEGPDVGGPCGPYRQSERYALYRDAWRRLLAAGWLYPCRCSRKDLAQAMQAPHDDEGIYPGTCRPAASPVTRAETPAGANWRFRVPEGEIVAFYDEHFGPQQFVAGKDFGDFLVWRRDDHPSYQLAVVADDAAMQISEVVRGADLLKSTARQILLARALGFPSPSWYHCDLLCDERGERLAKRHDSLSLRTLRQMGKQPGDLIHTFSTQQLLPSPRRESSVTPCK
ncbi:MAG TPA: tRNA glutamyl-Q(34) synthetase GluQRS [Acidobacteriaceae bacterium]|nr:tRNA glutamyl-Q(34) synthetase GluQRS [Acidobacteriaceae bacterium]